jgi:hypothetical protein
VEVGDLSRSLVSVAENVGNGIKHRERQVVPVAVAGVLFVAPDLDRSESASRRAPQNSER